MAVLCLVALTVCGASPPESPEVDAGRTSVPSKHPLLPSGAAGGNAVLPHQKMLHTVPY